MAKSSGGGRRTRGAPFSSAKYSNAGESSNSGKKRKGNKSASADQDDDEVHNLYEETGKVQGKRAQVTSNLTKDEMEGFGKEADGDEDEDEYGGANLQRIGNLEEDGVINSEDDEEIDSDEAFGASDEEQFSAWFGDVSYHASCKCRPHRSSSTATAGTEIKESTQRR